MTLHTLSVMAIAMSDEAQALCFLAGANSIFTGEVLLTTDNPARDGDADRLARPGRTVTGGHIGTEAIGDDALRRCPSAGPGSAEAEVA
ncbi:hypothetical protein [Ancylobacter lacus]|uniref:hypothetical protein n=1 Tax=Ancylobacter lacus TaxID=2579970 RepID=UPI003CCED992